MGVRLEITDRETGKTAVFKKEFVSFRKTREAMKLQVDIQEMNELETFDAMIDFVVDLFEDKDLTPDYILDNLPSESGMDILTGVLEQVMGVGKDDGSGKK
ncbi:hypothetical protein P9G49_04060 [Heyndrickxia coagulans]|uniref:phage tail assembly chaperone G n=1 Tax=Heyndrickxia coagulans TaxID=1398 RepID=UPI002DFECFF2|nr:hypothetical protein [Heyndrickxia coagulans]